MFFRILGKEFIFRINLFQYLFVKIQMYYTAFIEYRPGGSIFHRLCHVININIVPEYLAGIAVFLRNRSPGKTDEGGIWQTVTDDPGGSDVDFSVFFDLFKSVLSTVSFVSHDHDVATLGQCRSGFLELLHGGKDNAIGFPSGEQFTQIFPAGCLLRDLTEKLFAFGKLPIQLVVKVIAVRQNNNGGTVQLGLEQFCIKHH